MKMMYKVLVLVISVMFSASTMLNAIESENKNSKEIIGITVEDATVNENIIVRMDLDDQWEYMIFTSDGNCIRMGVLKKGKNKISLKDMCKGEYYVYINNGEERYLQKVMQ